MDPVSLAIATWVALKFTDQAAGRATGKVLDLAAGAWRRGEDSPKVRAALLAVLAKAVETAVSEVYPDDIERQRHVAATLLERDEALPVVDGTDLIELDHAVLRWVAAIEAPLGDDGEPTAIEPDHPLAGALCRAILEEVRREATRTGHALHPLWTDFQLMCLSPLLSKQESRLRDYWHPNMAEDGFIGRERELLMLAAALEPEADSGRFVMLGGMGGMGKTKLATAFAHEYGGRHSDGRIFYDFESYTPGHTPSTADQALVRILPTIREELSSDSVQAMSETGRLSAWEEATSGRRLLVVWDNVKSLDQIRPLLLRHGGCATIVTSRDHIDLDSERLWLGGLDREIACRLFTDIAGDHHDPAQVRRLVDADLRIPILIKTHARAVQTGRRKLAEILAELPKATTEPRPRTQEAMFELLAGSYEHLNPDQQYAFRILGAHPGLFITADAASVLLGCDIDEALGLMDDLVDVGMAERHHLDLIDPPRELISYTAHDILQAYAAHLADKERKLTSTRSELVAYYQRSLQSGRFDFDWRQVELDSIAAAAAAGSTPAHADLAQTVGDELFALGRLTEAAAAYTHAAEAYRDTGQAEYGHALIGLADVARRQSDHPRSLDLCRQAVAVFTAADDDHVGMIKASIALGHVARLSGRKEEALREFDHAADLAATTGNRPSQSRALAGAGHALRLMRRYDEAAERFQLAAELGDPVRRADALRGYGDILRATDNPTEADRCYRDANAVYVELGDRNGQANAFLGRGAIALIAQDWDEATRRYRAAADIFTDIGNRVGLGTALKGLGDAALEAGKPDLARPFLQESLAVYAELQFPGAKHVRNRLWELESRYSA
jgi:tetratricopeptide (TPR) repeat protein